MLWHHVQILALYLSYFSRLGCIEHFLGSIFLEIAQYAPGAIICLFVYNRFYTY